MTKLTMIRGFKRLWMTVMCSSFLGTLPILAAGPLAGTPSEELATALSGLLRLDLGADGRPLILKGDVTGDQVSAYLFVGAVVEPEGLCRAAHCVRLFSSRRLKTISAGDHVLAFVRPVAGKPLDVSILWGATSPLVLQPARSFEERAASWRYEAATRRQNAGAFFLETEASSGLLRFRSGKFVWTESPG